LIPFGFFFVSALMYVSQIFKNNLTQSRKAAKNIFVFSLRFDGFA